MFKRFAHILFALLILVMSTGLNVSKHYCGDTLKDIRVFVEAPACCEIPTGCCHQEAELYKLDTDYSFQVINFDYEAASIDLPAILELLKTSIMEVEEKTSYTDFSPPPLSTKQVLAFVQSYLL